MSERVLLGKDGTGWAGLRVTQPGYDATSVAPTDYDKLIFDSEWSNVEKVHQAGSFSFPKSAPIYSGGVTVEMGGVKVAFSALSYRPIVSVRRKTAVDGDVVGDEWWTVSGGGADPYMNYFAIQSEIDYFVLIGKPLPIKSFGTAPPLAQGGGGTWYFNYIVWALPIHTP